MEINLEQLIRESKQGLEKFREHRQKEVAAAGRRTRKAIYSAFAAGLAGLAIFYSSGIYKGMGLQKEEIRKMEEKAFYGSQLLTIQNSLSTLEKNVPLEQEMFSKQGIKKCGDSPAFYPKELRKNRPESEKHYLELKRSNPKEYAEIRRNFTEIVIRQDRILGINNRDYVNLSTHQLDKISLEQKKKVCEEISEKEVEVYSKVKEIKSLHDKRVKEYVNSFGR